MNRQTAEQLFQRPEVQALVDGLVIELADPVAKIEARPETTQHHYGDYMALFSTLAGGSKFTLLCVANAAKRAGGNPLGISAALRIITGQV